MKAALSYRSASIKISTEAQRERPIRAKSTQSHSQPLSSPLRTSSRYGDRSQRRVRQKQLTEGKVEGRKGREGREEREERTPIRYRLATSVRVRQEWEGVMAQRISPKKDMLQEQQASLAKLEQLRNSMNGEKLTTPIRYRTKEKEKVRKEIYKLKPRPLKGYVEYICGGSCEFLVGFDYSYLRRLGRAEASAAIDFGGFAVLQSVELCALDILEGCDSGGNRLLREYGLLFLRHFEKNMTEVVLATHYFRLAHRSLFLFLLHSRLFFLLLAELAANNAAVPALVCPLKEMLLEVVQTQRMLYQGRSDIDKQNNYINETFRILKIAAEVEKRAVSLASRVKDLFGTLKHDPQYQRLQNIFNEFAPLEEADLKGIEFELMAQTEVVVGWEYFAIPPIPFLPPTARPYTLVLSLEGVLLYYDPERKTIICRPYLEQFLNKVGTEFELIIFSSQPKPAVDQMVAAIEKHRSYFAYRLYKDHLSLTGAGMTKDLSKLGRETERVLMVDSTIDAPGVWRIPEFLGSSEDRVLVMLEKQLLGGLKGDLSKQGGRLGVLEHIEEQEEENTISTNQ